MSEVLVANASPIIALARVDRLDLLTQVCDRLLVPGSVVDELMAGHESDPARQAISRGFGERVDPHSIPPELLEWGLGPGETCVIALAREQACTAVLDDAAARGCAKAFGVSLIGTLGVVLRAKKQGLVSEAAEVFRALRATGLYLDERTIRLALGHVGESWSSGA